MPSRVGGSGEQLCQHRACPATLKGGGQVNFILAGRGTQQRMIEPYALSADAREFHCLPSTTQAQRCSLYGELRFYL